MEENINGSDHDLIIRVDERTNRIEQALARLENGLVSRVTSLEKEKADRKELDIIQTKIDQDFAVRLEKLELGKESNLQKINEANRYTKLLVGIGLIMLMLIVYHLTGIHL